MQHELSNFIKDFEQSNKDIGYLLEQLPIPIALCKDWQFVYMNSACSSALPQINIAGLIGRSVLSLLEEREKQILESDIELLRSGEPYHLHARVTNSLGFIDLRTISKTIKFNDVEYLIVTFQNLTKLSNHKKLLLELLLNTASLTGDELSESIVKIVGQNYDLDGVAFLEYRTDDKGEPIVLIKAGYLDGQVYKKIQYPLKGSLAEEMKAKGSIIIDRHLTKYAAQNQIVQEGQYESFIGKFLATEADYDIGIFVVSKHALYNADEIVLMLSMVGARLLADYTAQHIKIKNEHQERDSRLLFDQSAEPLFVLNSNGQILLSNYRANLLTGYEKHELNDFFSLISIEHQPFFRNFFQKKSGVLNHSNLLLLTKNNQPIYCDLSGVILSDGRIQISIRDTSEKRLAELAIRESEEKYRSIFNNASDAMFLSDWNTGDFIDCNPAFCELMGLSRSEVLQTNHIDIIGSKDRERFRQLYHYFQSKKILERKSTKFRIVVERLSGTLLPIEIAISQIDRAGGPAILGIIRDLSASYQAVEEHRKYLQTLSILKGIVVELDSDLMIRSIYNSSNKFGGVNGQNLGGTYFPDIIETDFQWYIEMVLQELLQNRKPKTVRFPCLSNQTGMDWYEAEFVIVRDRSSKARIRGLIKDVTFEYIVEKQTYFMSNTDMLTSLPNRNRLEEDLFRAMLRADRKSKKLAIGFIDLDRFFDVNDLLGHRLGDVTIALMAEKLRSFPELERSLYRWGGDQFVFLLEGIDDLDTVRNLLSAIRLSMKEPLTIEDQSLHVTGTVGVSLYPDDARTIDNLFGQADRALQYGKRTGRFQFLMAKDITGLIKNTNRMNIRNQLSRAIEEGRIEPYLQPIFDLQSNRVTAMEALARLPEADGVSRIGPEVFIPVAEDLGMIEELSNIIILGSVGFQQRLLDQGHDIRLSVNLSRRLLYSDRLIEYFTELLIKTKMNPTRICLEITESLAMLDLKNASERLHELKKLGFLIAIDDFGTGYSTLGQLYEIPVDELKIDKLFVRRIHTHEGLRITEAIVNMARALHLEIVAEGVEDEATANLLRNMGVRYLQGFYYSRPIERSEFERQIQNGFNVIA